jgi:hypothetical protein
MSEGVVHVILEEFVGMDRTTRGRKRNRSRWISIIVAIKLREE